MGGELLGIAEVCRIDRAIDEQPGQPVHRRPGGQRHHLDRIVPEHPRFLGRADLVQEHLVGRVAHPLESIVGEVRFTLAEKRADPLAEVPRLDGQDLIAIFHGHDLLEAAGVER